MEQEKNNSILPENNNNTSIDTFNQDINIQPEIKGLDNYVVDSSMDNIINSASEMEISKPVTENVIDDNPFNVNLNDFNSSNNPNDQIITESVNNDFNYDNQPNQSINDFNLDSQFNQTSNEIISDISNPFEQNKVIDDNIFSGVLNTDTNLNVADQLNNQQVDNVSFSELNVEANQLEESDNNMVISTPVESVPNNIANEPVKEQTEDDMASDEEIKKFFKDFIIIAIIVIIIIILLPYVNKLF